MCEDSVSVQHMENNHLYLRSSFNVTSSLNLPQSMWTSLSRLECVFPEFPSLHPQSQCGSQERRLHRFQKVEFKAGDILSLHSEGQGKSTRYCADAIVPLTRWSPLFVMGKANKLAASSGSVGSSSSGSCYWVACGFRCMMKDNHFSRTQISVKLKA